MRVACLQLDYTTGGTPADQVKQVAAAIARGPEADLVVLPELWDVAYFGLDRYAAEACELDTGPAGKVARPGAITVAGTVLERSSAGVHNTLAVLDRRGQLAASYRKAHLPSYNSTEHKVFTAGEGVAVVELDGLRIGLAICFDLRYPEQFAAMRDARADLVVVPAAWPAVRARHWEVLIEARAIDIQTPVVGVNACGHPEGGQLAGLTMAVDGRGNVLGRLGTEPDWLVVDINLDDSAAWRAEFPI